MNGGAAADAVTALERAGYVAHARTTTFQRRLREAEAIVAALLRETRRPYVAFSTGKDSTVVLDLVWHQAPQTPAVYFDADCAFPESRALLWTMAHRGPVILWPTRPFFDLLAAAGGPDGERVEAITMEGTVYAPIRALLAAHRFDGVAVGLRAEESRDRASLIRARGPLFHHGRDGILEALPVAHWSDDDVWAYLVSRAVPYARLYDRMRDLPVHDRRLSYWAGETKRRHGRWSWLRREYPGLFNEYVRRFPEVAWFT